MGSTITHNCGKSLHNRNCGLKLKPWLENPNHWLFLLSFDFPSRRGAPKRYPTAGSAGLGKNYSFFDNLHNYIVDLSMENLVIVEIVETVICPNS